MDEMKVSVIVPMYNSENTINRCIKSIQNQSYSNIEIIIINDGSTDNSMSIVNEIADSDRRIKLYNIRNKGVSHARNYGLESSTGDFVLFIDSDDYIDEKTIESLCHVINKTDVEIVLFDSVLETDKGDILKYTNKNILPSFQMNNNQIRKKIVSWMYGNISNNNIYNDLNTSDVNLDCYNAPWGAIYKKELLQDIKFKENLDIYEDLIFNIEVFLKCKSLIYIKNTLYHYVCNSHDSLSTRYYNNFVEMKLFQYNLMNNFITEDDLPKEFECYLYYRINYEMVSVLINEVRDISRSYNTKIKGLKRYVQHTLIKSSLKKINVERKIIKIILFLMKNNFIGLSFILVKVRLRFLKI